MSDVALINRTIEIQVVDSPVPVCGVVCVTSGETKHLCPFVSIRDKQTLNFKCTNNLTYLTIGNLDPEEDEVFIYPANKCIVFEDEVVKNFTVLLSNGFSLSETCSYKELNEKLKSITKKDPFYDDLFIYHTDIHSIEYINNVVKKHGMLIIDYGFNGVKNPRTFVFDVETRSWSY